ncbi:MAG: hypothetical protein ACT4O0_18660 [Pseudonocardia sp.]|jgi:hypothetical protein
MILFSAEKRMLDVRFSTETRITLSGRPGSYLPTVSAARHILANR